MTEQEEFEFRRRRDKERAARVTSTEVPLRDKVVGALKNAVMSPVGGAETAVKVGSGMGESALTGLAGIGAMATQHPLLKLLGIEGADPVETMEKVRDVVPTYSPLTDAGKVQSDMVETAMGKVGELGETLADVAAEKRPATMRGEIVPGQESGGAGPVGQTVARMVPELAVAALGARGPGAGKPRPIEHMADTTGKSHVARSEHGATYAERRGDLLQVTESETKAAARGRGEGTARIKKLVDVARENGMRYGSDTKVSPVEARIYDRLEAEGYKVTRNSHSVDAEGNLVSDTPRPVFEVQSPAAVIGETPKTTILQEMKDLLTKGGPERILTRFQRKAIGPAQRQSEVVNALEAAPEIVPGSKPTAAQALATTPAGSPIIAHQEIIAKTPGGPSAAFGERTLEQGAAQAAARAEAERVTGPMRDQALADANALVGIKGGNVVDTISAMKKTPGIPEVATKTLDKVQDKIKAKVKEDGFIDSNDLYTIRKEVGNDIKTFSKETANWDKKLTAKWERQIQLAIDDAIEMGGGTGWKAYLKEYSSRLQKIEADKARAKAAKKPVQRTNIAGPPIGAQAKPESPNMLSRTMMLANFLLKKAGRDIEPKINTLAAERYLNPGQLANALRASTPLPSPGSRLSAKGSGVANESAEARRRRLAAQALRQ